MSNLKLPNLEYKPLLDSLKPGERRKVAYETYVARGANAYGIDLSDRVLIIHHSTAIATLEPFQIEFNTGGWDSQTTANRMNRILLDNIIASQVYRIAVRQGRISVVIGDGKQGVMPFTRCAFTLDGGVWQLRWVVDSNHSSK